MNSNLNDKATKRSSNSSGLKRALSFRSPSVSRKDKGLTNSTAESENTGVPQSPTMQSLVPVCFLFCVFLKVVTLFFEIWMVSCCLVLP